MIDEKKKIRSLEISVGNHLVIDSTTTNWIDFWNATKLSAFHVKRKSLNDNEFLLTHTFVLDVPLLWNTGRLSHILGLPFLIKKPSYNPRLHFLYGRQYFVVLILVNWNSCFSRIDLCLKNKLTRDITLIVWKHYEEQKNIFDTLQYLFLNAIVILFIRYTQSAFRHCFYAWFSSI